jgi:DNA-directed RNA polymerase subunit M/transcription elongation factor TFIIS
MNSKIKAQVDYKVNLNVDIPEYATEKYKTFIMRNLQFILKDTKIDSIPEKDFNDQTWMQHIPEYKEIYLETFKNITLDQPTIDWKKCTNCGNTKYYTDLRQIRSLDEGQTMFYICSKCGKEYQQ